MDHILGEESGRHVDELEKEIKDLCLKAVESKTNAYCPYSKFRVGCAVLTRDGRVFPGCNVENASYPLCVCAERVAINNAVANGCRSFRAMAVSGDITGPVCAPCGACRQCLLEFGIDWDLYMVMPDLSWMKFKVAHLIPRPFLPSTLENERIPGNPTA